MGADRLSFARASGLSLPGEGRILALGPPGDAVFDGLDTARLDVVQPFAPDHRALAARGLAMVETPRPPYAAVLVTLPRARDLAEDRLAEAETLAPGGMVILDGAKTDGVEAMARALQARVPVNGQVSKAHGKVLWFRAGAALADWRRAGALRNAEGDAVAPGVFSADGADPGSRALAQALPRRLPGVVADLGAGWGWLSREILARDAVETLHLVEADARALDCARLNVEDPRARFHWADATAWEPPQALDIVVMNPPFHSGRKGDASLGQAFIAAAAGMLTASGALWLVANRHLPYERVLTDRFQRVEEAAGDTKYKILHAARPIRRAPFTRRGQPT